MVERNAAYEGSIPAIYEEYLGPALFDPYAVLVASKFASACGTSVLETACGTGIFTKHLRKQVPSSVEIVATDLNPGMLEFARHAQNNAGVRWQEANAMSLPFSDKTFSAVFCMFGIMFVPDKAVAFAEAARVLQPGGIFVFSVWDGLSGSPAAAAADQLPPPDITAAAEHFAIGPLQCGDGKRLWLRHLIKPIPADRYEYLLQVRVSLQGLKVDEQRNQLRSLGVVMHVHESTLVTVPFGLETIETV